MTYPSDEEGKKILWQSRPWQHKLEHRCNVLSALVRRQVTLRTGWWALRAPHQAVLLAIRPPRSGMLIVCPEAALEFFAAQAVTDTRSACEFVAPKGLDHGCEPGVNRKTVDSSQGNP